MQESRKEIRKYSKIDKTHFSQSVQKQKFQQTIHKHDLISNGFYSNRMFKQEKHISLVIIMLLIIDSILQVIYYQLLKIEHQFYTEFLNYSCFCHILSCLFMEISQLRIINAPNTNKLKQRIFNIFTFLGGICGHPYTFWEPYYTQSTFKCPISGNQQFFPLKINNLLILASILYNMCHIIAKIALFSSYSEPRSRRIHALFGNNSIFNLFKFKCIFRKHPILSVFLTWLLSTALFTLTFNILEHNVPIISNKFRYYENNLWFTLISMTSVGFGDLKPQTHYGYIIALICSVFGTFIMSLILIITIVNLKLDQREKQTLKSTSIYHEKLFYNQLARLYIRKRLWRLWINYKYQKSYNQTNEEIKLKGKLIMIKKFIHKQEKILNQNGMIFQQLQNIKCNISFLKNNNLNILNFITESMFLKKTFNYKDQEFSRSQISQSKSLKSTNQYQSRNKIIKRKQEIQKTFILPSLKFLNQSIQS